MSLDSFTSIHERPLHPEDSRLLDEVTKPRDWSSNRFKGVISMLAALGHGVAIPGYNRPDSVDFGEWPEWRGAINRLEARSAADGNEYGEAVFVDLVRGVPFFSEKKSPGTKNSATIDFAPPLSKWRSRRIGSVHTHITNNSTQRGLSDIDFKIFLPDPDQQFMAVAYGPNTILSVKTSATPTNPGRKFIEQEIDQLFTDYYRPPGDNPFHRIVRFNKAVSAQFGLILLLGNHNAPDKLTRVNVVD